jgi:hypothetical protein
LQLGSTGGAGGGAGGRSAAGGFVVAVGLGMTFFLLAEGLAVGEGRAGVVGITSGVGVGVGEPLELAVGSSQVALAVAEVGPGRSIAQPNVPMANTSKNAPATAMADLNPSLLITRILPMDRG